MVKKKFLRNRLLSLVSVSLLLVGCLGIGVNAQEITDDMGGTLIIDNEGSDGESSLLSEEMLSSVLDGTGSITVSLSDGAEGTSLEGVEFSCTKVGDVVKGEYELLDGYTGLGVDLNKINNAKDLESSAEKLSQVAGSDYVLTTDSLGRVVFSGLDVGVYLLTATNTDNYDDVTPFLISIPTWDEAEGNMMYDVTVIPKHEAKEVPPAEETDTCKGAPQTSVDSNAYWYLGGAVVALVALVAFNVVYSRCKNRKRGI